MSFYSTVEGATKLKFGPFCSSCDGLLHDMCFVKISGGRDNWPVLLLIACVCVSVCVGCQSGGGAGRGLPAGREGGGPCEGQAALPPWSGTIRGGGAFLSTQA